MEKKESWMCNTQTEVTDDLFQCLIYRNNEKQEKHGYWKYGNLSAYAPSTSPRLNADEMLM